MKIVNAFFILTVLTVLSVTTGPAAWGQLLVEDFNYTPATNLNGQGGWTAHSAAGTNPPQITSGGLSYPGYASSGIGNAVAFTTSGEDNNRPYASFPDGTTSGSLYYALMVRLDSVATTGDYFFHLAKTSTTFSARVFARRAANGNIRFGIGKSSTIGNINFSDSIYTIGTTYLLAVKYTVIAGTTNDTVALWVNPPIGGLEPEPTVLQSTADRGTTDIDTLYMVALRQGAAANASIGTVDGIRVGTTWESILAGGATVKTINNTLPTGGDNYNSFTDAINALNGAPVPTGGITFNVSAGQTFTENPPEITATGTSANQIVFQKFGAGANPKIIPATPGTVASSTTLGNHGDGILIINGGDYMTFDGIDLQTDPAFTGSGMMEYGYYLKKASGTDACKNVTIKNCAITLNKAAIYSFGIFVSNISGTTSVTVTSTGGRSENITLLNDTISNSYGGVQTRGFADAAPYDFYDTNVKLDNLAISNYGGGATTAYGVYGISQDSLTVKNSTISGGDGTTTIQYGIFVSTSNNSDIEIDSNTISMTNNSTTGQVTAITLQTGTGGTTNTHKVTNNTITISRPAVTSGLTYVIYFTTNGPLNLLVSGNTMENMNYPSTGTGIIRGIYQISSPTNAFITNNTIRNISRTSTTSTSVISGIENTAGTNIVISGNAIHSISGGGSGGALTGISASTGTKYTIFSNNIYNLSNDGASGTTFGITKLGTTDSTFIFNNFISDLRAPSSTSAHAVAGLNITATSTASFIYAFYNTIFLNATTTSATTFGSSGIFANTGPPLDLRNNVVVNLSAIGPTGGGTVAYRRSSATLTSYAAESNNNDFYVNTAAGERRYFYGEGTAASVTNADSTLAAYKGRVAPRDANTVAENPPFINASTPPYNLHINTATPTQLESGGTPVTSPITVAEDYDGDPRSTTLPTDIGADEFAGIGVDVTPPSILYTALGNTTAGTVRDLTAAIADPSGVPTAGLGRPVLYWKINSGGTYTGATGTFVSGDDFTFSFGAGTISGDTVYYFVAAQDSLNNVGVFPSAGAGGFTANPPAASTPPTSPSRYLVLPVFAGGTYTIGTTAGTYATLKAAFDAINNSIITGNVTLSVLNEGTIEAAVAQLNEVNYGPGGPFTITIKPAASAQPTISGAFARGGLIKLVGADNVTIDGSNTPAGTTRDMTLLNNASGLGTTVVWVGSLGTGAGATNVTVKNSKLISTNNDSANTSCIYAASTDTITASATGAHNNNLVIENNSMQRARFGVYTRGVATTGIQTGLVISGNTIGSDTAGYEISYRAIDLGNTDSTVVSDNEIFNMQQPQAFAVTGVHLDVNVSNATITGNTIRKLHSTNTGTLAAIGINVSSATGSTGHLIANNMISDLRNDGGGTSTASNPFGIRVAGGTNHKIYYNSVSLSGSFFNTTTTDLSAAFIVTVATATGLDIRNNIFTNTMTGGGTSTCYGIYAVSASTVFGAIDYNDYYVAGPNGILGRQGTTNVPDLAGWRTFTGQDLNSISADPLFVNGETNLHIQTFVPSPVDSAGTPIAGITTDIDNDTRNLSFPDIGADEFAFAPPVNPVLQVTPDSLAFGNVPVGSNSMLPVLVRNIGGSTLNVTNITMSNANFSASPTNFSLTPLDTTTVSVTFTAPLPPATYSGTMTFVSNDPSAPTVGLSGISVGVPVFVGSVDSLTRTLNGGTLDSVLFSMRNTGTGSGDFMARAVMFPTAAANGAMARSVEIPVTLAVRDRGMSGGSIEPLQQLPELMYYKFNEVGGNTTENFANPGVGTNPAPVTGLTMGNVGQFGSALVGNGLTGSSNNINTGWATALGSGEWTISMWINNFPATVATTFYFFGDVGGSTFRCFTGGVAGNNALLLRGTSLTDVPVTNIGSGQVVIHFVHEVTPSNVVKVYKNGVLVNTVAQTAPNLTGTGFRVGAQSTASNSFPAGCLMDEFRMYNRALSESEVAATWNAELGSATWLSVEPTQGTVAVGDSVLMTAYFDATDSSIYNNPGEYLGMLEVMATNSPFADTLRIPARMFVNAIPGLSGTYTVGAGGFYPTLDSAFSALSSEGVRDPVTFLLLDSLYRPQGGMNGENKAVLGEPPTLDMLTDDGQIVTLRPGNGSNPEGPAEIIGINLTGPIPGASATNRITIRPAPNVKARIVGTGPATFNFLNVSYVTFDGIGTTGATQLSVENTASGGVAFALLGNSDNNILQKMTIKSPYANGICVYADTASGAATDSNQILDNLMPIGSRGVYLRGGNYVARGNRIVGNIIGSDSIGALGIYNQQVAGSVIADNTILNVVDATTAGGNIAGIWVATKQLNMQIFDNVIADVRNRPGATAAVFAAGIYYFGTAGDTSRSKIYNNMVYDLDNQSTSATSTVRGLYISTGILDTVVYNTVRVTGTDAGTALSSAVNIGSAVLLTLRNNIAVNTRTATGTGRAMAHYALTTTSTYTSDFNDLYVPVQAGSHVAGVGTTNYTTLANWQATSRDSNSVSVMPSFQAPHLHINPIVPTPLNGGGTPIAGILTDIDGQPRNSSTPDIGADEFSTGFFDDFEAYTAGQQLACQNPVDWTTWSLAPCNVTEDPLISTAFAASGTKSVVIVQNNDLVKRFGSLTSGIYGITFKFYIPSGKAGYFNTLAGFTPNPNNWGMEAYFDSAASGNNGRLFAGSATAFPFSYAHNAWQTVRVVVNLNLDSARFFVNGNLIRTWRWTAGSSGGGSPLRLDANDFFGATAHDQMYMDDYDFYPDSLWTGVDEEKSGLPETFMLTQNYPNPFNPTTTIQYALPTHSRVSLKIYNILGQEILTLVNTDQTAGYFTVAWDGRNNAGTLVASGVYFYRIEAKPSDGSTPFTSLKKMLFLK